MININSVHLQGFYKAEALFLALDKPGVHAVVGKNLDGGSQSNGAGKSTIFEALTWCLYDRTARGQYKPEKPCAVIVNIEDDEFIHEITRKRDNGTSTLKIYAKLKGSDKDDTIELSGRNIATGNDMVQNLLGMDYDTFSRSVYFPQEGVIPFGYLTDKILKEFFLEKFLDIGWISYCYQNAKSEVTLYESQKINLQGSIDSVIEKKEMMLHVKDLAITDEAEWQREKADSIDKLEREIKEAEAIIVPYRAEAGKRTGNEMIAHRIAKIKRSIIDHEAYLRHYKRESEELGKKVARFDLIIAQCQREVRNIRGKLDDMESLIGTRCSECGSIITKKGLSDHRKQLENRLRISEVELQSFLVENEKKQVELSEASDNIKAFEEAILKGNEERQKLFVELSSREDEEKERAMNRLESKMKDQKAELTRLKLSASPYTERIKAYEAELEELERAVEEAEGKLKACDECLVPARFWQEGFGVQGIQSFLLETITPVLNSKIKKYLDMISDGMLKAEFHTVVKLKSGEYRERFGLSASKRGGADNYRGLSGGEKARVNLAVSLALGEMKLIQSEKEINLLILDEPFNGLDSQGVSDVLGLLREHFDQKPLYLVSHVDVDPSMVDDLIVVKYENGITSLEV
jgi:DNA repair exonuclease SbcCD ATPase subunit